MKTFQDLYPYSELQWTPNGSRFKVLLFFTYSIIQDIISSEGQNYSFSAASQAINDIRR